ncbi:MAG: efflux RND transporter periplasmic adaptor subunit [Magnetococcus sp. THC-1_WYH]
MNQTAHQRMLAGAGALLLLEEETRRSQTHEELAFLMVNRTASALAADTLFFFPVELGKLGKLRAVSGVSAPESHAPMVIWLNGLMHRQPVPSQPEIVTGRWVGEEGDSWQRWMPPEGMLSPLTTPCGGVVGVLLLVRRHPWHQEELELARRLGLCYGHAWEYLRLKATPGRGGQRNRGSLRSLLWVGGVLVVVLLAWPVRQSVMASAKVIAEKPRLVTATMDGVVARIAVEPNSMVHAGQMLLTMEETMVANRLAVAEDALRVAETELLRAEQLAFSHADVKANLPMLRSRIQERTVERHYAQEMLERSRVLAPGDGLALFGSAEEWVGQPVRVGQRIMVVADPDKVAIAMDLSIHDAVTMKTGGAFLLFLDSDPLHPRAGQVVHVSYEANVTPEGVVAFAVRGHLTDGRPPPRIGLRGKVRLFGEDTSLFFLLFRRPLSALRQFVGM